MKEGFDLTLVPFRGPMSSSRTDSHDEEAEAEADSKSSLEIMMSGKNTPNSSSGVRYRECMRNHAASIGGHANDGCGEFMPVSGGEEALKCAACGCHRNFHRKEAPGPALLQLPAPAAVQPVSASGVLFYNATGGDAGGTGGANSPVPAPLSYIKKNHLSFPSPVGGTVSGGAGGGGGGGGGGSLGSPQPQFYSPYGTRTEDREDRRSETPDRMREEVVRSSNKRFRTKFTQEQKDKMMEFAERIGWRIQRHDDVALSQFCLEIGVKRNVLKVWMHNNKNTLRKRDNVSMSNTIASSNINSSFGNLVIPTSATAADPGATTGMEGMEGITPSSPSCSSGSPSSSPPPPPPPPHNMNQTGF